jgi:polyhydroxyalkanoate synthesis regulator phasin
MIDLLKKTLLTGIGLTLMTKDKVEEVAREIASTTQMSADKGQEFVNEAVARAQKGRAELEATVQRFVQEALRKANVPTRAEFDALQARVQQHETHHGA